MLRAPCDPCVASRTARVASKEGSDSLARVTESAPAIRQERDPASEEVVEVATGVLRFQLPVSLPGLGHVNCYGLVDGKGIALVDPGLPGPQAAAALESRLHTAGFSPRHVHTVVVTHSHIDHFGGARPFAQAGAEVIGHQLLRNWWDPNPDVELEAVTDRFDDATATELDADGHPVNPWTGKAWAPPADIAEHVERMQAVDPGFFDLPTPTTRLGDADRVRLAGRDWVAVWTPGHTPDHLCLFDPDDGVLLAGDHVLPTITPHISGIGAGADPLSRYFRSLDHLHDLPGVTTVLPAHGHPFTGLEHRVDDIRAHHRERLTELEQILARIGPASVEALSHELFVERSWGQMAESETYAHLEHLRLAGKARRDEAAGLLRYATA